ncbi:hypothetical protein AHAS_Ahas19G0224600 [Arachis hypogaea]
MLHFGVKRQKQVKLLSQLHEALRPVKLVNNREDRVVWKYDRQGMFSTNSFVQVLQEDMLPEEATSYSFTKTIWKGLVPPRVELFSWFFLIGRANTKERLSRLGIVSPKDTVCVLCNNELESVWSAWILGFGRQWSCPSLMKEHFLSWTEEPRSKEGRKQRLRSFCAIIWNIWLERNMRIFKNKSKGVEEIINMTVTSMDEWTCVDPFCC